MKITQEFTVDRPLAAVWEQFQDVPAVAQCLPGATITEDKGGDVYAGNIAVKLGPIAVYVRRRGDHHRRSRQS